MTVSVNPVSNSRGQFVFHESEGERRIRGFFDLLRRQGVADFVLSFDDEPIRLFDLGDALRYGLGAAPAHLDLARRLARAVRRDEGFWLCGSVYCDRHLGKGWGSYAKPFLDGLRKLPRRIGIVWTGPLVISPSISEDGLAATRSRLGGRKILLYDNYPANDDNTGDALGLILGPLRHRDPGLAAQVGEFLACPMNELGASRLALLTIADYLSDPGRYDPDASWHRAIGRLAGPDRAAREALEAQAGEWGGWIGEPRYEHRDEDNAELAAESLEDPTAAAAWESAAERYSERMTALSGVADVSFRDDLLKTIARRLAVARAFPIAREYVIRKKVGRGDLDPLLESLRSQQSALSRDPGARRALDHFLDAAGIEVMSVDSPPAR